MRCSFVAVMLSVAIFVVPAATGAQQAANARVAQFAPSSRFDGRALPGRTVPVAEKKSAVAAGLLSLWMPGMGSFYAGDTRHGWRHVAIEAASIGLIAASCNPGLESCAIGGSLGLLVFLGNFVWAPITAVRDANAANARSR